MLKVEMIDEHGRPVVVQCSRVVVRESETNTPVLVGAEIAQRGIMAASAVDPDFQQLLQILRIHDTILVTSMSAPPPLSPSIK